MTLFDGTVRRELPNLKRDWLIYSVLNPPNAIALDKKLPLWSNRDRVIIDWEANASFVRINPWKTDDDAVVQEAIGQAHWILDYCEEKAPNTEFSFYGLVPGASFFFNDILRKYDDWRKAQERIRELDDRDLIGRLPRLHPSMYVPPVWASADGWPWWKKNMLTVLRRVRKTCEEWGKPFVPFIGPLRFERPEDWLEWVSMVEGEGVDAIIWNGLTTKPREWWEGLWEYTPKWALACQLSSGPTGPDHPDRGASWGIKNGWHYYVDTNIKPFIEWCQSEFDQYDNKILLHLPFGRTVNDNQKAMALDEYLRARGANQPWWYEEFVDAVSPLVEDGHEVIAYMGRPMMTQRIIREINKEGRSDNVLQHIWRSLRLPLEAGCSIGWDNMGSDKITDLDLGTYYQTKYLTGAWTEAIPPLGHPLVSDPSIIRWDTFKARHIQRPSWAIGRFPAWDETEFAPSKVMLLTFTEQHYNEMVAWMEDNEPDANRFIPAMSIGSFRKLHGNV